MVNPSFTLQDPSIPGAIGVSSSIKVMADDDTIFTIVGGPIEIISLFSKCITANNASATLVQYRGNPLSGLALTFSGLTASLQSLQPNSVFVFNPVSFTTSPAITFTSGVALGGSKNGILMPEGSIQLNVSVGPTTGTWKHFMSYRAMDKNSIVVGV